MKSKFNYCEKELTGKKIRRKPENLKIKKNVKKLKKKFKKMFRLDKNDHNFRTSPTQTKSENKNEVQRRIEIYFGTAIYMLQ